MGPASYVAYKGQKTDAYVFQWGGEETVAKKTLCFKVQ
jgi:hypothetical protein